MAGNWGGVRPGQGRRSKAEELGLPRLISKAVPDSENIKLIAKIFELALEGSFPHAKLYLEYKFGKPSENIMIDVKQNKVDYTKLSDSEIKLLDELTAKTRDTSGEV